eukprot:COSAG02_NODE_11314_length_1749_cov_1.529697_3_plen_53_part_00
MTIAVGRVRKSILGDDILSVFTVGDQVRVHACIEVIVLASYRVAGRSVILNL